MKEYTETMTTTEVKPISIEVTDLMTSETVSSANVTHTPPSGDALTITPTVSTPNVYALFGPFAVTGAHTVKVQAVGSLGSKPEVVFSIWVVDP